MEGKCSTIIRFECLTSALKQQLEESEGVFRVFTKYSRIGTRMSRLLNLYRRGVMPV